MVGQVFGVIILWIIGLFILYLVIYTAVKDGINKSLVGQFIERNYETKVEKKSFLDNDLDNDWRKVLQSREQLLNTILEEKEVYEQIGRLPRQKDSESKKILHQIINKTMV